MTVNGSRVYSHIAAELRLHACSIAGGAELARKLVDIYFSLFRLILEGRLGHAGQLAAAAAARAQAAKRRGPPRKPDGAPANSKPGAKPGAKHPPSSDAQVASIGLCAPTFYPAFRNLNTPVIHTDNLDIK
jgi:hypothetical protein